MSELEYITDSAIYDKVIIERIPFARKFVWIATSDLRDCTGRLAPEDRGGQATTVHHYDGNSTVAAQSRDELELPSLYIAN